MSQNIFVTGATGVIGRHVVPELVRLGHRVTAIGRSDTKRAQLAAMGATAIAPPVNAQSRIDESLARRALDGHDTVINLATHMPPSSIQMMLPWEWRENDRVRRDDSAALVSAAIAVGTRRFLQESFGPVYKDAGTKWIDETWPIEPTKYNLSVRDAERSAERFSESGGTGIVLRFGAFYGPDALLRDMISVIRRGWSPLPGPANAFCSSVAQEDAASATVALAINQVAAGIYNVCDDEPITRGEWAATLASAVGAPRPRTMPGWMTRLGGSTMQLLSRSQRMSNAKIKQATGWSPRWPSAREGLPHAARLLTAGK